MYPAVQLEAAVGKRAEPVVVSAATTADSSSRLFVTDLYTGVRFLVDTGADVSVLPALKEDRRRESHIKLTAANQSSIKTYGSRLHNVDIGLRRDFAHTFILADIGCPILGADFLSAFHLLPDLRNKKLVDGITSLSVAAASAAAPSSPAASTGRAYKGASTAASSSRAHDGASAAAPAGRAQRAASSTASTGSRT